MGTILVPVLSFIVDPYNCLPVQLADIFTVSSSQISVLDQEEFSEQVIDQQSLGGFELKKR